MAMSPGNFSHAQHPIIPLPFDARRLGAAAAKYIDAFFRNINWDEINRRLERADKAAAVLQVR